MNLFIFYIIIELSINFDSWHLIFISNEFWKNIIVVLLFLSFIIIINLIKDARFETVFLFIMTFIGSLMIILCDNLLIIYLGLELQTFSLFILIAKNKSSIKSSESALKYFILGALSSGLFLLGVSLIFSSGLSLNVKELSLSLSFNLTIIEIAIFLICISLFFKLAIFPLHFWIADIYEGANWEVVSLISTIPKISVLCIIMQISNFSNFFILCGIVSIIIGSIAAMNQTKMKRLLAYSGISHIGFILLGIMLLFNQSYEASVIYLFIYILTILGIFMLIYHISFSKNDYIIELGGLSLTTKLIALSWLLLFLSIAGIPPLSGFISKWFILISLINNQFFFIVIIAIIFSAVSAGYYLRIVKITYFQKSSSYMNWNYILKPKNIPNKILSLMLGLIIYMTLTLIIHPTIILTPIHVGFNYFF